MINFIKEITQEAAEGLLTYSKRIVGEREGTGNWVTEADLASERLLIDRIKARFPDHQILSEETQSQMENPKSAENLWVLDPLDGTTNFSFECPNYSISVAYLEKGVVKNAAVCDPTRKELFWAQEGQGAFLNDERIFVRTDKSLSGALVHAGTPYTRENFEKTARMIDNVHKRGARVVILGSAVLGLAYVATGRLSLFFEVGLKPWDVAAASLIITEAGGMIEDIDKEFDLFNFQGIVAGNPVLIQEFLREIKR